ncbi:MAG: hypothetical protein IPO06_03390 [Leptospiraceae bacterium]|nr:hypothetical protein [Leptospiraceae bacterium]
MTTIELIKEKMKNKDYDSALSLFKNIEESLMSSEAYVFKGICVQLSDNGDYTLKDVEEYFLKAIQLEPSNLNPKIELAWFYLNVANKPGLANQYFEEAFNSSKSVLKEILIGIAKSKDEMEVNFDYKEYLMELENLISTEEEIVDLNNKKPKNTKLYSIK